MRENTDLRGGLAQTQEELKALMNEFQLLQSKPKPRAPIYSNPYGALLAVTGSLSPYVQDRNERMYVQYVCMLICRWEWLRSSLVR